MRALLLATSIALLAVRAAAAADCLAPLHTTGGWACHADLSNGESADFCLAHTNTFGDDPAARFFKINSTGRHVSTCSCGTKGKSPGAEFRAGKSLLCFDEASGTVTSGRVSSRKIAGQTFDGSADLRSAFSCRPDPTCTVEPFVDVDLPAEHGAVALPQPPAGSRIAVTAGGRVDVGYLGGACTGFASEAPTLTYDVEPTVPGQVVFWADEPDTEDAAAGVLVVAPSGVAYCNDATVSAPLQAGRYAVWILGKVAGDTVDAELVGAYDQQ
jgi:hypothetical protein